ncbi:MAG: hypothetical protein ABSF35_24360 [Polyangia bacterium]|jgi:hypothetical protein
MGRLAFGIICLLAAAPTARAERGTCQAEVSGDLNFKIEVTESDKLTFPSANGPLVAAATDYWLTEQEQRKALLAMNAAFDSVGQVVKKKGPNASQAEIRNAATAGASAPSNAAGEKRVDADMKKDPRIVLLLVTCVGESLRLSIGPTNQSKYANVPFRPGHYKILPTTSGKAGDFGVIASVKDGAAMRSLSVSEPGVLDITQFDAHSLKGKFSFTAQSNFPKPTKTVAVKGSFSVPCKGESVCKP